MLEKAKDVNWLDVHLKSWYQELKSQGISSNSRAQGYASARSFYRWNNIALPRAPRETRGRPTYESDRIYTKDEVRKMLHCAKNPRDVALLLLLANNPQREEVVSCLKWRMISDQLGKERVVVVCIPEELLNTEGENCNKNSIRYRFAFGSEVSQKIQEMMDERKAAGERIEPESWLFRSYSEYRSRNPVQISRDSDAIQLSGQSINKIIKSLAETAGIQQYVKTAKITRALFHAHGFRPYWKAAVREAWRKIKSPIDSDLLKFEIGDTVDQQGAYDKFSEAYLREVHSELEPYLRITDPTPAVQKDELALTSDMQVQHAINSHALLSGFDQNNIISLLIANQVKIFRLEEDIISLKNPKGRGVNR